MHRPLLYNLIKKFIQIIKRLIKIKKIKLLIKNQKI